MDKPYSVTRLRTNLYRVLDRVLETGVPAEVARKGEVLRIVRANNRSQLANLPRHQDYLACDPETLVHLDWSGEWHP